VLLLAGGCGYSFTAAGRLTGGVQAVAVHPFENRSAEPELGAAFTSALREELAGRGLLGRGDVRAAIAGEVAAGVPVPAVPGGVGWRIAIDVRARLVDGDRVVVERTLRRETSYAAGIDALETEGRRALALRKLAADCARELVATLVE
jgi:hypothetical protein